MKKCLSTLLAVCMLLALVPVSAMAAAPDMSGTVINVNAAQAQDVLDGKYGSINGKTINFVENITDVLELRPGRYEHSNTTYYNYVNYALETTATPWSDNISTVMNSHSHYYRTIQNVTFTANAGVSVAGFECKTGYFYEAGNYDPVRNITQGVNEPHHRHVTLTNLVFDSLTITGHFDASLYEDGSAFENLTFNNCEFTGTTAETGVAALHLLSDSYYFKNTVVTNCAISNYFQGIYISGIEGAVIENNTIENTKHNSIALQSSNSNPIAGNVSVQENYLADADDRAIRINVASETAAIAINNNIMVDCGGTEGELLKATTIPSADQLDLENNYWDGKGLADAITGEASDSLPVEVGIKTGTFQKPLLPEYTFSGFAPVKNADGSYSVVVAGTSVSYSAPKTGDDASLLLWTALLVLSVLSMGIIVRKRAA